MVRDCCVVNCHSRSHDKHRKRIANGLRFFSFPTWKQTHGPRISELTKKRRMAWVAAVRRPNITFNNISENMLVCSRHFHSGKPAYEMYETHPDWTPSFHLGYTEVKATHTECFTQRMKRQQTLTVVNSAPATPAPPRPEMDEAAAPEVAPQRSEVHEATPPVEAAHMSEVGEAPPQDNIGEQEEYSECSRMRGEMKSLHDEMNRMVEENMTLRKELSQATMDEASLKDDDVKVRFYTGLPYWTVLQALHTLVIPCLTKAGRELSPFQMLLLTLMRLRLNLPQQHLAHLFCVSRTTVATVFRETICVLHHHLSDLVHWPARHCLQFTMPHQFVEAFGNRVAVIVDCFEIGTERPSNLKVQAQTYSHYKQKHTVKYLIGITPQGSISFISKGWGGRVSDKHLTENSGLLNKLLPGDLVLAGRGFDIGDHVALMCAEVKIPGFTRGRAQMDPKSVEETRRIAHLRVHVKRVIGLVRNKYRMLHHTIPVKLLVPFEGEDCALIDKIVTVCCALTNMCPSVVLKPPDHALPDSEGEME